MHINEHIDVNMPDLASGLIFICSPRSVNTKQTTHSRNNNINSTLHHNIQNTHYVTVCISTAIIHTAKDLKPTTTKYFASDTPVAKNYQLNSEETKWSSCPWWIQLPDLLHLHPGFVHQFDTGLQNVLLSSPAICLL